MKSAHIALAEGVDRQHALRLAGALERFSEHPIAQAIATAAAAENELQQLESFTSREGLGVEGVVDGDAVVVGGLPCSRTGRQTPAQA